MRAPETLARAERRTLAESADVDSSTEVNRSREQLAVWVRSDHPCAQLLRFASLGGLSSIAYLVLFLAFDDPQLGNLAGSIVSTALANELHRRLTFRAAARVTWFTAQLEGGALALAGLALTAACLAILERNAPGLSDLTRAGAVLAVTAGVGTLRFLALRLWIFRLPEPTVILPQVLRSQRAGNPNLLLRPRHSILPVREGPDTRGYPARHTGRAVGSSLGEVRRPAVGRRRSCRS